MMMFDGALHRMLRYAKHLRCKAVVGEHRCSKFQCITTSTVGWPNQSHPLKEGNRKIFEAGAGIRRTSLSCIYAGVKARVNHTKPHQTNPKYQKNAQNISNSVADSKFTHHQRQPWCMACGDRPIFSTSSPW